MFWPLSNKGIRKIAEKVSLEYMKTAAPKEYHNFLTPSYPLGCKRLIIDPGYLDALNRPNVNLIWDPITQITENGILCSSGKEHMLDVIILGTGFDVSARGFGLEIYGSNGQSMIEQWEDQGGPQAYLGTTLSNFPNFFTLLGPNVATGHTSAIAHIEAQVNYLVKMVKPLTKYGVDSLELKPEAEAEYNAWLHRKLNKTVWQGGCKSYYRLDNGKIIAMWPGTYAYFWWKTRTPNLRHYIQRGGSRNLTLLQMRDGIWHPFRFVFAFLLLPYFCWSSSLRVQEYVSEEDLEGIMYGIRLEGIIMHNFIHTYYPLQAS